MPDATAADISLEDLPTWDLSDLYPGMKSGELESAFKAAEQEAKAFAEKYEGKLASLSAEGVHRFPQGQAS